MIPDETCGGHAGGETSLGYSGPSFGWSTIEDSWSRGGLIDPTTGGITYTGAYAIAALLSQAGVDWVKNYARTMTCSSSATGVMGNVESNFSNYADYSRWDGLEQVDFFPPADLSPGSTIPITVFALGTSQDLSVNVLSMDSQSMSFSTNPGHLLYPGQITFASMQAGSGIKFTIDISGTVAQPLNMELGGSSFEDAQWHHFLGQVQAYCNGGQ